MYKRQLKVKHKGQVTIVPIAGSVEEVEEAIGEIETRMKEAGAEVIENAHVLDSDEMKRLCPGRKARVGTRLHHEGDGAMYGEDVSDFILEPFGQAIWGR